MFDMDQFMADREAALRPRPLCEEERDAYWGGVEADEAEDEDDEYDDLTVSTFTRATGDCFQAACQTVMNLRDDDAYRVVHGWPIGQGDIAGRRHAHAWVERTDPRPPGTPPTFGDEFFIACIDRFNGKDIELPRAWYYGVGHIRPEECRYYTVTEALALAVHHGHWGPWHDEVVPSV